MPLFWSFFVGFARAFGYFLGPAAPLVQLLRYPQALYIGVSSDIGVSLLFPLSARWLSTAGEMSGLRPQVVTRALESALEFLRFTKISSIHLQKLLICDRKCSTMLIMATRTPGRIARRATLPLTDSDLADLERMKSDPSLRAALDELMQGELTTTEVTESALVHAIWVCGIRAVREHAEAKAYLDLAASFTPEEVEERRHYATRNRSSWTD